MASGGRGRGRGRGRSRGGVLTPDLAIASGGGGGIVPRECESCRSAPGIPFCRVEWSFLCTGCAAVVHGHNWIVAVPPNPSPSLSSDPLATAFAYPSFTPFPYPNPNANPGPNPNPNSDVVGPGLGHVVQLSSDEDLGETPPDGEPSEDDKDCSGHKRRRRSAAEDAPVDRAASVMRYKEKRNTRNFDKTVRYEKRKEYADSRPRVDGKFARAANAPAGESKVDCRDSSYVNCSRRDAEAEAADTYDMLTVEPSELQTLEWANADASSQAPVDQLMLEVSGKVSVAVAEEANATGEQLCLDAGQDANTSYEVVRQLLDVGLDMVGQLDGGGEEDQRLSVSDGDH